MRSSALVTLSSLLFIGTAVCAPVAGSPITVYVQKDPNDPTDLQPVTTLAPIAKRDKIVLVSDPTYPDGWRPIETIKSEPVPVRKAPKAKPVADSHPKAAATTSNTNSNANDGSPLSGGTSILSTINKWRAAYGKHALSWSQEMVGAATNTGNLNGGGANGMNHHAPSNAAEVIAPGSDTDFGKDLKGHTPFEISFIAWLCEVPSSTLGNACAEQTSVMIINQSGRGHFDILTDNRYSKIGCAFTKNPKPSQWYLGQGQWTCDLTF